VYYPLRLATVPTPSLPTPHLVIKILAASLNHREVFIRQNLYPSIDPSVPLGADGVGIVQSGSTPDLDSQWRGKRVVLVPGMGWDSDPLAPESRGRYTVLGAVKGAVCGTLGEFVAVPEKQVVLCPPHLSNAEAAAFPLAGLTAYRALFTKGQIKSGSKLLITGIGGGVGLAALMLAVAAGAEVYVTSSSEKKINRAKELGAKDGILYTNPNWSRELKKISGELDVVLDSAGGDICTHAVPLLKQGGTIVTYGMTLGPKTPFTMQAVLKVVLFWIELIQNIDYKGSTMGSTAEFHALCKFLTENKVSLEGLVDTVFKGLESAEEAFEKLKNGTQFGIIHQIYCSLLGKLVISVSRDENGKL
jgi:NADPH:quinone reductase-like Zn-dependent oxidoreductase